MDLPRCEAHPIEDIVSESKELWLCLRCGEVWRKKGKLCG